MKEKLPTIDELLSKCSGFKEGEVAQPILTSPGIKSGFDMKLLLRHLEEGGSVVYWDIERALDPEFFKHCKTSQE